MEGKCKPSVTEAVVANVPGYLRGVFPRFLARRRKDVDSILAALDKNEFGTIRLLAHNMIGTGRLYGLERVSTSGCGMEQAALQRRGEDIRKDALDLSNYLARVIPCADANGDPVNGAGAGSEATVPGCAAGRELMAVVVDDSEATRAALVHILADNAIRVVGQAGNGVVAIALCARLCPDVVFLDVILPGISGLEVLAAIRPKVPEAAIVMVTSVSDRKSVLQSKALGADEYILKPFNRAEVEATLRRVHAAKPAGVHAGVEDR